MLKKISRIFVVLAVFVLLSWASIDLVFNIPLQRLGLPRAVIVSVQARDTFAQILRHAGLHCYLPDEVINTLARAEQLFVARDITDVLRRDLTPMQTLANLQSGEYRITPNLSLLGLLQGLATGGLRVYRATILEGWTFAQMKQLLLQCPQLKHDWAQLGDAAIMSALGLAQQAPEGWFFPDTYLYQAGESDANIFRQAYRHMQLVVNREWQGRQSNLAYESPYQGLIMASLIEREVRLPRERAKVGGVLYERWRTQKRLQVDPTINYGLNLPYGMAIHHDDLFKDTLYNTYRRKGLPPTPIALPSEAAIHAAFQPEITGDLFYVAKGDDGSHVFSKTFEEHQVAVAQYRSRIKNQPKGPANESNAAHTTPSSIANITPTAANNDG